MLYSLHELAYHSAAPFRIGAQMARQFWRSPFNPAADTALARTAWACQIVSRRCARRIGRLQQDRALAAAAVAEPAEAFTATEEGDAPAMARLRAAVAALPPDQRAAIGLFYLEDMEVADVAIALNVPAGTVKTRLMHARRKLRAVLEGDA